MSTAAFTAWTDQTHRQMTEAIRRHGCWNTYVSDDAECPCCAMEAASANRAARRAARKRGASPPGAAKQQPGSGQPPFCYTTGLHGIGHPELLVFGLSLGDSSRALNQFAHDIAHGNDLTPGEVVELTGWKLFLVEELPNPGEILLAANDFYGRPPGHPVAGLQLTWADGGGNFPGDPGYAYPLSWQPRPGTFRA